MEIIAYGYQNMHNNLVIHVEKGKNFSFVHIGQKSLFCLTGNVDLINGNQSRNVDNKLLIKLSKI
jgi:hypothetical protein